MPIIALLLSALLVAADQLIKLLAVEYLQPVGQITVIPGIFNLLYLENRGAAFGILQNQKWFFIAVTGVITLAIIFALFRYNNHEFFSYAASILIIGGGIGNLIDRVRLSYVIDYLSFSFFSPIFNFADCCVTVGTLLLVIHFLFFAERESSSNKVIRRR